MFANATPAQKFLSKSLAVAGGLALAAPLVFNVELPGVGLTAAKTLWAVIVWLAFKAVLIPELVARHFTVTASALGVLWISDMAMRPVLEPRAVQSKGRDAVFCVLAFCMGLIFYAFLPAVLLPASASWAEVALVFIALAVFSWPVMLIMYEESEKDETAGILNFVACLLLIGVTGLRVGCSEGEGSAHALRTAVATLSHCAALLVTWVVAGRFLSLLKPTAAAPSVGPAPGRGDLGPEALASEPQADVAAPDTGDFKPVQRLLLEEDWDQRFARQRAERQARQKQGYPG
jgi:hypothetical protein